MESVGTIRVQATIELNVCANVYGSAPCTASNSPGFECTNSFATCQDPANYVRKGGLTPGAVVLSTNDSGPRGNYYSNELGGTELIAEYPCIDKITHNPTEIKRGDGVASRGSVDIICTDFAGWPQQASYHQHDPYYATREDNTRGSFFGKLLSRFPYLNGAAVEIKVFELVRSGADGIGRQEIQRHNYLVDRVDGPTSKGRVTIKCKDYLTMADPGTSQFPLADGTILDGELSKNGTSIPIKNSTAANWSNGDYCVIDDEAILIGTYTSTLLTGCTRAQLGTAAAIHDDETPVLLAKVYTDVNVIDIIYALLVEVAGVPASLVPYNDDPGDPDEWDDLKAGELSSYNLTQVLSEPTGVMTHLNDICKDCYLNLWFDTTENTFRLSNTNTADAVLTATEVTEADHMLEESVTVREMRKGMISQVWVYYGRVEITGPAEANNYKNVAINVNTALESANAWNRKNVKAIAAKWLDTSGAVAIITAFRWAQENDIPRREATWTQDFNSASALTVGRYVNLRTDFVQDYLGLPDESTWQIIKIKELELGITRQITASVLRPTDLSGARFAKIVNVANENVEYGDATPADRDLWGWIAATDGFENKDEPYLMS